MPLLKKMKFIPLAICSLFSFAHSFAQSEKWTVKAGDEIKDAVSADIKYRYPTFATGTVYFKDGTSSSALLDFNLLNEEMQFINPNGDTLSLANEATIKYITINNDSFYYAKGYLELVSANSFMKLAKKQRLKIGDVKRLGGYDQPSSTSAITSYSSLSVGNQVTKINQRADILLAKETTFYIGDNYNSFVASTKRNIIKMFPRKESEIDHFLNENKIRFNNQDDLIKLVTFLQKIL